MSLGKKFIDDDKTYCISVAKSISDILRFSLDEEFRKSCFELFKVSSTQETEREIKKILIHLIQNESPDFTDIQNGEVTLQNKSENTSNMKDPKNSDTKCANQTNKETVLSPSRSTVDNIRVAPQNIFKRNWLQISSQQYNEIIKRKKLNFYSQPQFNHKYQNDFDFFGYDNSQTSSSCPSLSLEENISLPEPLGDTVNYCKNKFRDSFKDNAQKYFIKNLRSHRHM